MTLGLRHKESIKRIPLLGPFAKQWFHRLKRSIAGAPPSDRLSVIDPTDLKFSEFQDVQITSDRVMRRERRKALNKACDIFDWNDDRVQKILKELNESYLIHRKSWEYAQTVIGLEQLNCIRPDSRALSVGAGHEKLLYYFANRIHRMIGTDLYDELAWPDKEADPSALDHLDRFAPFPYRQDHLRLLRMNGCRLGFQGNTFDFVYTLSSIEHFGGHQAAAGALREIERVLKPGGIACIVTELVLNGKSHPEFFNRHDLERYIIRSHNMKLVEPTIDFRISESSLLSYVDYLSDPLETSPHVVLRMLDTFWTSIILFFKKEGT